jgi:hypothetical protein
MKLCSLVNETAVIISAVEADIIVQLFDGRHIYL